MSNEQTVTDLILRHMAIALHRLPPRVFAEYIVEDMASRTDANVAMRRLQRFAAIDPERLVATGGDRMPPMPLSIVPKGGHEP